MISVVDLQYFSNFPQPNNGVGYDVEYQKSATNLYGELGSSYGAAVSPNDAGDAWIYQFTDQSVSGKQTRATTRTVSSSATCEEYKIIYGGMAGFNAIGDPSLQDELDYVDGKNVTRFLSVDQFATGSTTWMGNSTSINISSCGPRCAQILALQNANNCTVEMSSDPKDGCFGYEAVPEPRLWACNNTISNVTNTASKEEGFDDPKSLQLPDAQAQYLAGSVGWSGITAEGEDGSEDDMQQVLFRGDTFLNVPGNVTADGMAQIVMRFSVGVVVALDQFGGPRQNLTGDSSPAAAQMVNVKWKYAATILIGIPVVQFMMLLGVVWFSGKAIILEPSYMTAAHLLRPVLNKLGEKGPLLSVDEMSDRLGEFKIAYGVRPDPQDPGHRDTTFVRDLDVIEQNEGFGYIRGKMPEGRYD